VATTALARVCHQDEAIAVGELRLGSPYDVTARAEVFARDDDGELPVLATPNGARPANGVIEASRVTVSIERI